LRTKPRHALRSRLSKLAAKSQPVTKHAGGRYFLREIALWRRASKQKPGARGRQVV
jgi:hypothetical protein